MKKKLIYISHWRFPSEKTMTPLIMKTCEGFVREGFEVELWVPRRYNPAYAGVDPFVKYGIRERFPIRQLPVWGIDKKLGILTFFLMVFTFNVSVFFALRREKKLSRTSILYGHDMRDFIFPSFLHLPLFIEIHDFYESSWRFINKIVLDRTKGLIITNSYKLQAIAKQYGYPEDRMIRQPNAVSFEMFNIPVTMIEARHRLNLPYDVKIALYTGHLFKWKGVYTLAQSVAHLPADTYVYFVGGTVEDREVLKSFVVEKKLPRIVFMPPIEHSEIPFLLKAADVLVLPNTAKEAASKFETSPVKLFEYMASGVPIVASDIPSIREIVSEKEVQFFKADDPQDLAEKITKTIGDKEQSLTRAAMAKILAKSFSWEARAKSISALIYRLA